MIMRWGKVETLTDSVFFKWQNAVWAILLSFSRVFDERARRPKV
jgi:hypothetical protein